MRKYLLIAITAVAFATHTTAQPNANVYVVESATFTEGLAPVQQDKLWGYINQQQQWVIPAKYSYVQAFSHGMAAVAYKKQWGYIDSQGTLLVKPAYDQAYPFSKDGYAIVKKGDKFGVIDRFAQQIVPIEYDSIAERLQMGTMIPDTQDGWFRVARYNKNHTLSWGLYSAQGKLVIPPQYDNRNIHFHEGLAAVSQHHKWGYVDYTGKEVINLQYDAAKPFSQGYAAVMQNGKWGYINALGETVIPMQFLQASTFHGGIAHVVDTEKQEKLINLAGQIINDGK